MRNLDRDDAPGTRFHSSLYKILSDLIWLDDSLQAGRIHDLLTTVQLVRHGLLPEPEVGRIRLAAYGNAAFTAVAAALLDTDITSVQLDVLPDHTTELQRTYDFGAGRWQWIVPGWAQRFTIDRVVELLGDRLRVKPTGRDLNVDTRRSHDVPRPQPDRPARNRGDVHAQSGSSPFRWGEASGDEEHA